MYTFVIFVIFVVSIFHLVSAAKTNYTFQSQGEAIACNLYSPSDTSERTAIVVAGPGFPSIKELFFPPYGEALASAGIAFLVFDNVGFGESTGKQRQDVVINQQHATYRDALSSVAKDSRFNSSRLGVMGKSLSGAHSIYMAASDNRVKAAVSIVPHIKSNANTVESRVQFMEDIASDVAAKATGGKRTMIRVFGPPGAKAVMTTDGADESLGNSTKGTNYRNEVTASSLLEIASYDVSLKAKEIKIPILAIAGNQDGITPAKAIHDALNEVDSAQVYSLNGQHFTVTELYKETLVDLTVKWFQKHL
jgi:cephalosporin-C deacetylase-like acetyl esterase